MKFALFALLLSLCPLGLAAEVSKQEIDANQPFDDSVLTHDILYPAWFKLSFMDLKDDINDALTEGKKGIILYFGRKDCPYCEALLTKSWGRKDIIYYTQKHFDVIAINTKGTKSITDFDGFVFDEKEYSKKNRTNFTPSLLFYDTEEKLALRLSGYQQPYRFMAALEYVADGHYKKQSFGEYLSQAKDFLSTHGNEELNHQPFFDPPPHNLNRKHFKSERPLAVFFEKRQCHACDILHANPLEEARIRKQLSEIDVIQLDVDSNENIITPQGLRSNISDWQKSLDLHYTPTLIFFDESGNEIIRIDSVVWVNRLHRVLQYITTRGYRKFPDFQDWRNSLNSGN